MKIRMSLLSHGHHYAHMLLTALTLALASVTQPARAAPGDLDTGGFGLGTGKVITPVTGSNEYARALALQPDGKILVAGRCGVDFCLVRYLPSGALDVSFNTTGTAITPIGSGTTFAYAYAVALQPDGNIVTAGACSNGSNDDFCLVRHLPSGALDTSFNSTGKVITPIGGGNDTAYAITLQPDGKLVAVGACSNGSNNDFCLARYLPSGALDTSFNATGKVMTPIAAGDDAASAVALQPDGAIVVAGYCSNGSNYDFCLARYLPSGALDTTFNATGKVTTPIGSSEDVAHAIALQPDGKIVVAGNCLVGSNYDFCIARYLPGGAPDLSFNASGKAIAAIGSNRDLAFAITLQPDGKIVVAGGCSNGSNFDFCLARFLPIGSPDLSFHSTGIAITPIGTGDAIALAVALQPDGKIVVAGNCFYGSDDFCLARYEGGPFDARNCSLDIDGDNQVLATTDALIHTRIALGMTGPAVISGITFASHAARQTWPDIRNYLVTQCGMSLAQ